MIASHVKEILLLDALHSATTKLAAAKHHGESVAYYLDAVAGGTSIKRIREGLAEDFEDIALEIQPTRERRLS